MPRNQRRRLLVDRKVQGALLRRVAVYWLLFTVALIVMSVLWNAMSAGPLSSAQLIERLWAAFGPALLASVSLMPIVVIDSLRLSNRFAGPMHRLRRVMREASEGQPVEPVRFRDEDYWREFAEDFNRLVAAQSRDTNECVSADEELPESFDASPAEQFAEV